MRNNKGITLISLIIYIIVLMIVIALMSNVTSYFLKNVRQITLNEAGDEDYLRLTAFITKDINSEDLTFAKDGMEGENQYLVLKFGNKETHQYICNNNNIYFLNIVNDNTTKKINLCAGVSGDNIFNVNNKKLYLDLKINNKNYSSNFSMNI